MMGFGKIKLFIGSQRRACFPCCFQFCLQKINRNGLQLAVQPIACMEGASLAMLIAQPQAWFQLTGVIQAKVLMVQACSSTPGLTETVLPLYKALCQAAVAMTVPQFNKALCGGW